MHKPIPQQGRWLQQVVTGYFNYHAVPTNSSTLTAFLFQLPISGGARYGSGARKTGRPGSGSSGWPTTGSRNRESFVRGQRVASPLDTQGGRSYGAGGGGRGIFIVHTNRRRLSRGPSQ